MLSHCIIQKDRGFRGKKRRGLYETKEGQVSNFHISTEFRAQKSPYYSERNLYILLIRNDIKVNLIRFLRETGLIIDTKALSVYIYTNTFIPHKSIRTIISSLFLFSYLFYCSLIALQSCVSSRCVTK